MLYLKELEKEEQIKSKVSKRKGIIKITEEINRDQTISEIMDTCHHPGRINSL